MGARRREERRAAPRGGGRLARLIDELGAHVSNAGGVENAPARAAELDSVHLQLFTKNAQRWVDPEVTPERARAFREARAQHGIRITASHDSYLINLASPDAALFERSLESFRAELRRCIALGIDYLVTHPGNATDGDRARGLEQNAAAIERALRIEGGDTMVLLEHTAGTGTALGSSFEELRIILDAIAPTERERVGVCLDTCHLWSAGYDIVGDYEGVIERLGALVGLERVRLFHVNDSKTGLGSARDRHEHIGKGSIGLDGFRNLLAGRPLPGRAEAAGDAEGRRRAGGRSQEHRSAEGAAVEWLTSAGPATFFVEIGAVRNGRPNS